MRCLTISSAAAKRDRFASNDGRTSPYPRLMRRASVGKWEHAPLFLAGLSRSAPSTVQDARLDTPLKYFDRAAMVSDALVAALDDPMPRRQVARLASPLLVSDYLQSVADPVKQVDSTGASVVKSQCPRRTFDSIF